MSNETSNRVPTMKSALGKIISSGIEIASVIDVGVQAGTDFLLESFPIAKHYLFEPVNAYFGTILDRYRDINHELHQIALSSSSGMAFQVGVSADKSSRVTHSYLSDEDTPVGKITNSGIVMECKVVGKATLDSFFAETILGDGYLVKIDVDGHEMPIIQGGQTTLKNADVVIIEAPMRYLMERVKAITELGLELVEIVDLCYYYDLMSQVDLIFINKKDISRYSDLNPWATKEFSFAHWHYFKA